MNYKNPILLCDYSDPDVIRVGDDFFLTASSFNFVPGLPILHSRDLVHWRLVNYAAKSIPLSGYEQVQNAKGVWAPSIRFHGGKFYIFFATPDEGIFFTSASDPYGEWSELHCVWSGRGFEDPCPLWENDANGNERLFVVHAYVKSRIGFNSKLGLLELDPKNFTAISEDKIIFDGTKTQPTIEGPKFYKRNGFYYIFAPAGGVTNGWQTVLRSKRIDGGYEEKIVLAQGKARTNGPHQGGWVTTPSGEDWFMHFQDSGIFGRIVHLQPMRWIGDWCVMGNAVAFDDEKALSVVGEPVEKWKVPKVSRHRCTQMDEDKNTVGWLSLSKPPRVISILRRCSVTTGSMTARKTPSEFQFSATPNERNFATTKNSLWLTPSVCTKKIDSKKFSYEKEFSLVGEWRENERRGIIFLGNEYAALQVEKSGENEFILSYLESSGSESGDEERSENVIWSEKISRQARNDSLSRNDSFSQHDAFGRNDSFSQHDSFSRNDVKFVTSSEVEMSVQPECIDGANLSAFATSGRDNRHSELALESITLKMKFAATKDGKSGTVRFFVSARGFERKISFKSEPFTTTNAHWVGGRFGWF